MAKKLYCNMCGNVMSEEDISRHYSLMRVINSNDGDESDTVLDIDICCDCMKKIVEACKISPITSVENYYSM